MGRTILRVQLTITAQFEWNDRLHSSVEPWWIWIEDSDNEQIYHSEYFLLYKLSHAEAQKPPKKVGPSKVINGILFGRDSSRDDFCIQMIM